MALSYNQWLLLHPLLVGIDLIVYVKLGLAGNVSLFVTLERILAVVLVTRSY